MIICTRIFLNNLLIISFGLLISLSLQAQDYGKNVPFCDAGQNLIQVPCGKKSGDTCFACGYCGDGITDTTNGEQCDAARANSATGECRDCNIPNCGDGIHNEFDEAENPDWTCDTNDTSCRNDCTKCGDNKKNHSSEECDGTDVVAGGFCKPDCSVSVCGDGEIYAPAGETCEPSLDSACRAADCAKCGDGTTQEAYEECDDGNSVDTDYCTNSCTEAVCGDSIVGPGEECDDGNDNDADPCRNNCRNLCPAGKDILQTPCGKDNSETCYSCDFCGNGIVGSGELCDDGNKDNQDSCTNSCRPPACGDGIVHAGEQCDRGSGNGNKAATFNYAGKKYYCTRSCTREVAECESFRVTFRADKRMKYKSTESGGDVDIDQSSVSRSYSSPHLAEANQALNRCFQKANSNAAYNRYGWISGYGARYSHTLRFFSSIGFKLNRSSLTYGTMHHVENSRYALTGLDAEAGYQGARTIWVDKNCNPINPRGNTCIAGNIDWTVRGRAETPISLILEEGYDPDLDPVVSTFAVTPEGVGQYFVWKASDKAPLLVYDPEHTGVVSSTKQLFGNWTFGGKSLVSNMLSSDLVNSVKWENGYEALATLDHDGNGKVDGEELEPLALWFDTNRDGVSDHGEVRSVNSEGIQALYYEIDGEKAGAKTLYVNRGYDRNINGKLSSGKSVDWYTTYGPSQAEAINNYYEMVGASDLVADTKIENIVDEDTYASTNQIDLNSLSGVWAWDLEEKMQNEESGGLLLLASGDGSIEGYSILMSAMRNLKSADSSLNLGLTGFPLDGKVKMEDNGDISFDFVIEVEEEGLVIKNRTTGKYLAQTDSIAATTSSIKAVDGENTNISYDWTAVRAELGES